jgi:hypothetical protein
VTANFYSVWSSVPRPTPSLEDQGISLSLAPPSKPVQHGWPYQQLRSRRHSPPPSNKVLSTRMSLNYNHQLVGLLYNFQMIYVHVESRWDDNGRAIPRKTCPSVTLSTTNPTYTNSGANPGLRGGKPAANRLNHGTAKEATFRGEGLVPREMK